MDLEIPCFNQTNVLPQIVNTSNQSEIDRHLTYDENGRTIYQLISSSIINMVFPIEQVQVFLRNITSNDDTTWDASKIVGLKPVTSTIIFISITLVLFVGLCCLFCIFSCRHCGRRQRRMGKCSMNCFCMITFIGLILIAIGQMAILSYQVNRARLTIDESIRMINGELYSEQLPNYLKHLIRQLENADQYTKQGAFKSDLFTHSLNMCSMCV